MGQLRISLMTVSPLIMHGNDRQLEIRASSFRGIFRYWTRALLGREIGDDLKKLQEAEGRIWGSTGNASAITVHVSKQSNMKYSRDERVLPERQRFPAFAPNRRFELTLKTHPLDPGFPLTALGAIMLAFRLGGLGTRSRRGGGNLLVLEAKTTSDVEHVQVAANMLQRKFSDTGDLINNLGSHIQDILGIVPNQGHYSGTSIPGYPVFTEEHTKTLVNKNPYNNHNEALQSMWGIRSQPPFHDADIFGLPNVKQRKFNRRASPVHMRVTRTRDGYHPIMTIFRSRPDRSWAIMQDFVDTCTTSGFVEVFGGGHRWT